MYTQLVSNVYIIGQIPNSIPLNETKCVSECDGLKVKRMMILPLSLEACSYLKSHQVKKTKRTRTWYPMHTVTLDSKSLTSEWIKMHEWMWQSECHYDSIIEICTLVWYCVCVCVCVYVCVHMCVCRCVWVCVSVCGCLRVGEREREINFYGLSNHVMMVQ